jgi:hypothetical protein
MPTAGNKKNWSKKELEEREAFTKDLLKYIRKNGREHGINVYLSKGRYLIDGTRKINGYFDEEGTTLAVATNQDWSRWVCILIHEFSHMQQWIDQDECWTDCWEKLDGEDVDVGAMVDEWVFDAVKYDQKDVDRYIQKVRDMEGLLSKSWGICPFL